MLAGGLGTRLRSVVPETPKCLAPVAGRPFLAYVLDHFQREGVERFIFALGYRYDAILEFLDGDKTLRDYAYTLETEPLGTGGAIRLACTKVMSDNVLVINGDTLFRVRVRDLDAFHQAHGSEVSLCLKPMREVDRYGAVDLGPEGRVLGFREKRYFRDGLINGGVYELTVRALLESEQPPVFSFERDFLERRVQSERLYGLVQDAYFIDIGIPEDYERAQKELSK